MRGPGRFSSSKGESALSRGKRPYAVAALVAVLPALAIATGLMARLVDFSVLNAQSSETFSQLSAGYAHTCGVKTDGTLLCWGVNGAGQATPPAMSTQQVSAGLLHTCAVKSDGTLACWGDNSYGQSSPPPGIFTEISAGGTNTCAVAV